MKIQAGTGTLPPLLPLEARPVPRRPFPREAPEPAVLLPTESRVASYVARLVADERAVDRGLAAAMRGDPLRPAELIALQVQTIRYSQELEVASRVVEKVTSAIRLTLQTQV